MPSLIYNEKLHQRLLVKTANIGLGGSEGLQCLTCQKAFTPLSNKTLWAYLTRRPQENGCDFLKNCPIFNP